MLANVTKYIAICLVFFCAGTRAISQDSSSENYSSILNQILSLQFDTADSLIEAFRGGHEMVLEIMYLENYLEFLDALIGGDRASYENYLSKSVERLDSIRSRFGYLPGRLSVISAIHLQSSFLNAYHGDNLKAARNFYVAKRYLRQLESAVPENPVNEKLGGLIYLVAGSAPAEYNWLMKIFGIRGDAEMGLEYLGDYHDGSTGANRLESCLILLYARQMTGLEEGTGRPLTDCGSDTVTLQRYFYAYHALKSGHSREVTEILGTWRQDPGETSFSYLDLLLGEAMLNNFQSEAGDQLLQFLQTTRGDHYVKTAWHKLSWYYYLNGDSAAYREARENVIQKGNMILDADKQAFREAGEKTPPNPGLLKSRLYFDGGHYWRSREILLGIYPGDLASQRDSLEYTYRLARISDCLGEIDEAIVKYHEVIKNGQGSSWYFPSNAALLMGMIYEDMGKKEKALESYHTCLKMNRSAYKNSIGNKAKQGIRRLK